MKTTTEQPKHTQGEWNSKAHLPLGTKKSEHGISFESIITNPNIGCIATAYGLTKEEAIANAERIVGAVNMHDGFLKFVQEWVDEMEGEMKYGGQHNVPLNKYEKAKQLLKQAEQK